MAKDALAEKLTEVRDSNGTCDSISAAVFPLALTPFEKYFVWDDRPEQPLTPIAELHFSTRLNKEALGRAIARVIAKNPTLNSLVVQTQGDLHWQRLDEPPRLWCPATEPLVVDGMLRPFDLSKEPGCRFWYEEREEGSRVVWQLHHATTDGIGMRSIVIDVLLHYAMETASDGPERYVRELYCDRYRETELLRRQDYSHLPAAKRGISTWQRIKNAHYFHFYTPTPLRGTVSKSTTERSAAADTERGTVLGLSTLDAVQSERVFAKCQSQELEIHELAMALLFRTCAEWNRSLGDKNSKSHIRIMMPVDLRGRSDLRMPAANRLSFMFFGRSYRQCDDFPALLKSVQKEFVSVKETQLYLDFLNAITAVSKWPKLMRWGLGRTNSMATAVLTYVGDVTRGTYRAFPAVNSTRPIGDAVLTAILAAPPVRRNTNVAIGLGVNWGQITISASWNRAVMTGRDCEKFLELYKTGWQRWCEDEE